MCRNLLPWALAVLLLSLSSPARAEETPGPSLAALPAFDLERMDINPGRGSLLVGSGELLLPGTFWLNLGTHYERMPLEMRTGDQRLGLVKNRMTGVLTGALGVLPWLEVALQLPMVAMQAGDNPSSQGLLAPASRGLGTPEAHARMGVSSRRAGHPIDMAVDLSLGIPVGSAQALAREKLVRLQADVLMGRKLGPVHAMLEGGLLLRVPAAMGPTALTSSKQGQELRVAAGLTTEGTGLQFEADLRAALALQSGQRSTELLGGVRYPIYSWLELFGMGGMGFGSLPGTPGFRLIAGVSAGHPPPPESPVTRRASSWQQPLLPETDDDSDRPQPLRAPPERSDTP